MQNLSSTYPHPPSFYKQYTDENIQQNPQILNPPEPIIGPFEMFGQIQNIDTTIPSLKELGFDDLFEQEDLAKSLKIINHSLLASFLDLLKTLETNTLNYQPKVDHIRLLLIHMHHRINEYRPHQARETLILMLEEQVKRRREAADRILAKVESTKTRLKELKL